MYTFSQIAELVELPGAFMIGAGAGPHRHVGCCCEVIINVFKPFMPLWCITCRSKIVCQSQIYFVKFVQV